MSVVAYIAFGSNLGDRRATLVAARSLLIADSAIRLTASSPLYETNPVGGPPGQPPFFNAVVKLRVSLPARTLLYGDEVCAGPDLTLPHPRLHLRPFVLAPLCDIAPGLIHPVMQVSVGEMLAALDVSGVRQCQEMEW